jgi:hypothetical protein
VNELAGKMKKRKSDHCGVIKNESYWEARLEHFGVKGRDEDLETLSMHKNDFVAVSSNPFEGTVEQLQKDVPGSVFSDGFRPV